MIITVTGHRPKDLWGYNYKHPAYQNMYHWMVDFLAKNNASYCISGMALGVDTVFAFAVLEYKRRYPEYNIIFECAIPCRNQDNRWSAKDKKIYKHLIDRADVVTMVSDKEYAPELMQRRNEYMVDRLIGDHMLLAIWNGNRGGTGNCVKYANKVNKKITVINPKIFEGENHGRVDEGQNQ